MRCKWKTVIASDYCIGVTDGTHDSPKPVQVGKHLITSRHLGEYLIDFSNTYRISEADYVKVSERSKVEQWDILFSMIGTVGRIHQEVNTNPDYAIKNIGLFRLGGNRLKSDWLKYFLHSPMANEYILSRLQGSTQGYVTLNTLRALPIAVPSEDEQRRIICILSSIDAKIENNNRINQYLSLQGYMQNHLVRQ